MSARSSMALGNSSMRALRASTSRSVLRSPGSDRYLAIHAFFTRQAAQQSRQYSQTVSHRLLRDQRSHSLGHRYKSTDKQPCEKCEGAHTTTPTPPDPSRGHAQDYAPFIRRLINRTQSIATNSPHRPTKEELLGAARSGWERFRIRLKWFFIRGWRRFNTDDFSAFASLFVVGNSRCGRWCSWMCELNDLVALWILIGTTTFVSAVFATLNSLSLQEYVARWISDYLTSETGVQVM